MFKPAISAIVLVMLTAPCRAEGAPVNVSDLKWSPAPSAFPPGGEIAVLSGDPSKDGLYVIRFKMPANYQVPAHNHPTAEYITVISGDFHIGMGDKLDTAHAIELRPGGFGEAPAGMNHFAFTTGETIVQIHGQGPFAIKYVNPADDPRNR